MPCASTRPWRRRSISAASPKPLRRMSAPSPARARAIPRPMPEVDPVTTATFPFSAIQLLRVKSDAILLRRRKAAPAGNDDRLRPFARSLHVLAAVDGDVGAGDEGRLFGAEVDDEAGHLLRLAEA